MIDYDKLVYKLVIDKHMETSKLYRQLGRRIGITAGHKTQRGIIARKILAHIDRLELNNFRLQFRHIKLG